MPLKINLPKVAKGKRPMVFDDPNIDHLVTISLELSAELYTIYARLHALERHLERQGVLSRAELEAFKPDEADEAERAAWRDLFLDRMFRTIKVDKG